MKELLKVSKTIAFTDRMAKKIQKEADVVGVSFSDIVRACVENDLPKLKERYRQRRKYWEGK